MADKLTVAELAEFSGKNIAHNLDFVPEDKLHWKPAPTAKSVAEIVDHIGGNITWFLGTQEDPKWAAFKGEYKPVTSIAEARKTITDTTAALAAWIREVPLKNLETEVETPVGPFKGNIITNVAVFDLAYHSGQICYLQSLWGDEETHMEMMEPIVS